MNTNILSFSLLPQGSLAVLPNLVAIEPGAIAATVLDENPFVSFNDLALDTAMSHFLSPMPCCLLDDAVTGILLRFRGLKAGLLV